MTACGPAGTGEAAETACGPLRCRNLLNVVKCSSTAFQRLSEKIMHGGHPCGGHVNHHARTLITDGVEGRYAVVKSSGRIRFPFMPSQIQT